MTRLPVPNPQSATGSAKEILDGVQRKLGTVPNMIKVMSNSPAVLQAYAQFSGALSHAALNPRIREQIAILAAERNGCTYCLSAHTALGKMAGLDQSQLDAARHGEADDPRALAALTFAGAVLSTGGGVGDHDVSAVRKAGFSDAEIAEIVAVVALNVFTNLFNRTFAVEVDFPRVEAGKLACAAR